MLMVVVVVGEEVKVRRKEEGFLYFYFCIWIFCV